MSESMVTFQINRRHELEDGAEPATGVHTGGKGSSGNTAHLNLNPGSAPSPAKRRYHRRVDRREYIKRQQARTRAKIKRKPMSVTKKARIVRDARRKAVLAELASMGYRAADMARMVGFSDTRICHLIKAYGIVTSPVHHDTPKQRAVRAGYAACLSIAEIAQLAGSTPGSVKAIAHKLGITIKDPWLSRRGFSIPVERRAEYRHLTTMGLYAKEAGMCMGLLPREIAQ